MFGKLTIKAFQHDLIENGAGLSMLFAAIVVCGILTYKKRWHWIWKEWLTTVDPKKIGAMYIIVSFVMLVKGMVDAVMMRAQQAMAAGDSFGYLEPAHFQQVFTAHGTTMIFFVAMGVVFGLFNMVVPLQIGARDVAFPFLNSLSFYLFVVGVLLVNVSLVVGNFSGAGWTGYPPLTELKYSPDVGVDYWIWSLQISGIGTMISGINFLVTIFTMRCPGMTLMRMPLFTWSALASVVLVCFAFPILTITIGMLSFDRLIGTHFFTTAMGGNPMMYINLIWAWGHPEVYILILPAFGIFSEVVATYAQKKLFGYVSMVWAIVAITFLSFIVWVHHFFTMGAGAKVNAFFGIMTMIIAIPTGVKVFNWLFTCYRGRIIFASPMLWFMGFIIAFTIGGMAGVLLSVPPADFQIHNSLFLIAHFHSMILPGVLFGFFAGATYWFPKFTGFKLHEGLGKAAAWCWIVGFVVAFVPLYLLGFMGATRRLNHYEASTNWQPMFIVAAIGSLIIFLGIGLQVLQLLVSFKERRQNKDVTGDPWNGRTLEWSTASPPPIYNFAHIPTVHDRDAFWEMKQQRRSLKQLAYEPIHLPKNTAMGLYIGAFSFALSFGLIWYIWWLAAIGFIGALFFTVYRLCQYDTEFTLNASEVASIEADSQSRKNQA